VSEVRKVKNVRPLTCGLLVELRLQSETNHQLALARKYMNRRGKNMQTRSHELVRIFGGHLGVQFHIHAAEMLLESKSRKAIVCTGCCEAR
jgi:hypothetical protein